MKKRNCRKTKDERRQHDVAIRIRKMTDAQIFELVGQVENANPGAGTAPLAPAVTVGQFIDHLDALSGTGNGIGKSTIYKLRKVAEKEGLLNGV